MKYLAKQGRHFEFEWEKLEFGIRKYMNIDVSRSVRSERGSFII